MSVFLDDRMFVIVVWPVDLATYQHSQTAARAAVAVTHNSGD